MVFILELNNFFQSTPTFRQKNGKYDFKWKTLCFFYQHFMMSTLILLKAQQQADRITRCALLKMEMKQKF